MKAIRFFRLLLCMLFLATSLLSGCTDSSSASSESSSGQAASESSEDETASGGVDHSLGDGGVLPPAVQVDDQIYLISDDRFGNELPDEIMERLVYCGAIEKKADAPDQFDLENFMIRNLLADIGDPIYKYTDPETEEKLLYVYNESGERWFEFNIR